MEEVHILAYSTTRGRYALDRPDGPDVTAGSSMAVLLGGAWIAGTVEYGRVYSGEGGIERGYYFISDSGERSGLCVGMHVRVW